MRSSPQRFLDIGTPVGCPLAYDWNCDGVETKLLAAQPCTAYTTEATCPGFVHGSLTACGEEAGGSLCAWDNGSCIGVRGGLARQSCY